VKLVKKQATNTKKIINYLCHLVVKRLTALEKYIVAIVKSLITGTTELKIWKTLLLK
jgi:hypothetical protein